MPRLSVFELAMVAFHGGHTPEELKAAEVAYDSFGEPWPYQDYFGFPQWVFACASCGHEHPSESNYMGTVQHIKDCEECSCSANNIQFVPPSRSFESFSSHKGS